MSAPLECKVGERLPVVTRGPIERIQLVKYAGASGDFNRIHVEEDFAKDAGFPSVIAHGMLSMAFVGEVVSAWAGPRAVRVLRARFKAVTFPGETVTAHGEVTAVRDVEGAREVEVKLWVDKPDGTITVEGSALVRLPR